MTEGRPASQSLWAGERSRVIGHVSYLVEKDCGEELRRSWVSEVSWSSEEGHWVANQLSLPPAAAPSSADPTVT